MKSVRFNRQNNHVEIKQTRLGRFEALETRRMLTGVGEVLDGSPYHNDVRPLDVDGNWTVEPADAIVVINDLNQYGVLDLSELPLSPTKYVDVDGDGYLAPADVIRIVNLLNSDESGPIVQVEVSPIEGGQQMVSGQAYDQSGLYALEFTTEDEVNPEWHDIVFNEYGEFSFELPAEETLVIRATDAARSRNVTLLDPLEQQDPIDEEILTPELGEL